MTFFKHFFNKLKGISKKTKFFGLLLIGAVAFSCFEVSESTPFGIELYFLFGSIVAFSVQITLDMHKWLSKPSNSLFSRRTFFIFLGLLIINIAVLVYGFASTYSNEVAYESNILLIAVDIVLSLIMILFLVAPLPLAYITIFIAKGPFRHPRTMVVLILENLIVIPFVLLMIFGTDKNLELTTEKPVPVMTQTPTVTPTPEALYGNDDNVNMVKLPISTEYSNSANRFSGLQWWTKKIEEHNLHAKIFIEYPQFIDGDSVTDLNRYIRNLVLERLEEDRNSVKEWITDKDGKFEDDCSREPSDGTIWSCSVQLQSEYKVSSIVNDIVSIELILTDYTGGGNGNHEEPKVINWDLKSNRLLKMEEIFCTGNLTSIFPLVYESVLNQFVDRSTLDKELIDEIKKETSDPENYKGILIGYSGITIVFPPYYVLGGAAGIVRAPISYSSIPNTVCLP